MTMDANVSLNEIEIETKAAPSSRCFAVTKPEINSAIYPWTKLFLGDSPFLREWSLQEKYCTHVPRVTVRKILCRNKTTT